MVDSTGFPGFIRLSARLASAGSDADPCLETGLLRHRPASALPLSWQLSAGGGVVLFAEVGNLQPLCRAVQSIKGDKATGYRLFERIMTAVDEALDHLLLVEQDLLRPDLIFTEPGCPDKEPGVKLICLPFSIDHAGLKDQGEPLMDFMARVFQWDPLTADRFSALFAKQAYGDLLEEARALAGPPCRPSGRRPAVSQKTGKISSMIQAACRVLLGAGESPIHEITHELDLAPAGYKIAQLSEGLPGTPEEEYGHRAYILTEEFFIGRDLGDADLCIDSSAISRIHARILLKDGSFFIEDLGSKNGTSLDGVRLNGHRQYLLPDKCRIAFAGHFFYFRCE
ncbi:MAG TPA: FHA domain-containing protein [Bacillota bacterium]|jgi:hypothetical protein|nr:FHA domain-containing protein [Bacillota bacterium]HQB81171.1 FHA domain-containing protein [Bacillota bacterium]